MNTPAAAPADFTNPRRVIVLLPIAVLSLSVPLEILTTFAATQALLHLYKVIQPNAVALPLPRTAAKPPSPSKQRHQGPTGVSEFFSTPQPH
jgi:hypothetical protein